MIFLVKKEKTLLPHCLCVLENGGPARPQAASCGLPRTPALLSGPSPLEVQQACSPDAHTCARSQFLAASSCLGSYRASSHFVFLCHAESGVSHRGCEIFYHWLHLLFGSFPRYKVLLHPAGPSVWPEQTAAMSIPCLVSYRR